LFEILSENTLKGDLSSDTTSNPPLFSLFNTFSVDIELRNHVLLKKNRVIKLQFIAIIYMCAEIRSVPTSNSLLVPEPESQLVPADYAVPELAQPSPPPPATLHPDRQTGGQKLPDRQKGSVQNCWQYRIKTREDGRWLQDRLSFSVKKGSPKHNLFEHGVFP
jgi:hypothetical protein